MPWFYVDDGFSDSKPVENLPDHMVKAPLRLAVCGLWLLAGSWSAKEETDGLVPASRLRQLGGTPTIIRGLVDPGQLNAPLCFPDDGRPFDPDYDPYSDPDRAQNMVSEVNEFGPSRDPIRFRKWSKWQKTKAEQVAKRRAEAEKKRGQRMKGRNHVASSDVKMSLGDITGDNQGDRPQQEPDPANTVPEGVPRDPHARARRPDPTRPDPSNSPTEKHAPNVGTDERGLFSAPAHPTASRLVATLIPNTIPSAVRTGLRIAASQLINGDHLDTDVVAEALRRWLAKPGAGAGLLASLAADVIRERAAPNGQPASKLRTIATLAADERAREQAALESPDTPTELTQ